MLPNVQVEIFGEGTPYEAKFVSCQSNGEWAGYLRFTDPQLSPIEEGGLMTFAYLTPRAAGGALARARAENEWLQLCEIFKSLRASNGNGSN